MANISPGVYSKILDISSYAQVVPSTIGFIAAITEKGRDNELVFVGGRSELTSEWGNPDISKYGKSYGQGLYCAYNYLGESGSLYFMRCLPDSAQFANMRIDASPTDSTATISITYVDSINTMAELDTNLVTAGDTYPICFLYPVGRGVYYNGLGVRFTEHSNPMLDGVYVMDIYERQSDGNDVIIESFEVSFNAKATDDAGDSIFIADILETYSAVLRANLTLVSEAYTGGYDLVCKIYDKDIGAVSVVETSGSATITDIKQDFSDWEADGAPLEGNYIVIATDEKGNKIWGWLGAASGTGDETIAVYLDRDLGTQEWQGSIATFDADNEITYVIKASYGNVADAFSSSEPVPLKYGSDGLLLDAAGDLDTDVADEVLAEGYSGILIDPKTGVAEDSVLDTDDVYFTLVFDCGYPSDVKDAIYTLVTTRRDCIGIIDNGDNASYTAAMTARQNVNTYNTYFCALYEEYNKVYDIFTGKDVWFSPVYHMSYILPRNDTVSELWYAAAGFNRAAIDTIKELRFNPRLGQRDQMYLSQMNPIVKFSQGYVVWGQLTTQAKATALQDLNIARLVLYCQRALEEYCRNFVFEQNDSITWNQVSSEVVEFLEAIKKRRGLYNYNVNVYATDYMKKRKTFAVDVILNPTRVSEKIELNFFIV